jgi:gamma-glutamyl:cysteine ligase YbdK (ATP-grasp superfamily)
VLDRVIEDCRDHAAALGCEAELDAASGLARDTGADRQRRAAAQHQVSGITSTLADAYAAGALRR